jgi:uncharacterized protein with beta-barrel porin domain
MNRKKILGCSFFTGLTLFSWTSSHAAIEIVFDVSASQNTPEVAVTQALGSFCPNIQSSTDADTVRLAAVCLAIQTAPLTEQNAAYRALSARSATSIVSMMTRGPLSQPIEIVRNRMASLRKAVAEKDTANIDLKFNGQALPDYFVAELFDQQRGGAASADELGSRLSGFFTGMRISPEQTETKTLVGFDGDTTAAVFGVDYRVENNLFAGVATRFGNSDIDLKDSAGSLDTSSTQITFYTTKFQSDSLYLDATVHYGRGDLDLDRLLDFTVGGVVVKDNAKGSTSGTQYGASVGIGSEEVFAQSFVSQLVASLRFNSIKIDSYQESNATGLNLNIAEVETESMILKLGGSVSNAISTSWGIISPQIDAYWMHEFKPDGQRVKANFIADPANTKFVFTTDELDSDYFTFSIGTVILLQNGFSAFLHYEKYFDYDDYEQSMVSLGARAEF